MVNGDKNKSVFRCYAITKCDQFETLTRPTAR